MYKKDVWLQTNKAQRSKQCGTVHSTYILGQDSTKCVYNVNFRLRCAAFNCKRWGCLETSPFNEQNIKIVEKCKIRKANRAGDCDLCRSHQCISWLDWVHCPLPLALCRSWVSPGRCVVSLWWAWAVIWTTYTFCRALADFSPVLACHVTCILVGPAPSWRDHSLSWQRWFLLPWMAWIGW